MSRAVERTDKTTVPPYGERVMALRAEKGWSQLTLATRAGCSEGTIRRVEEGERTRYTTLVLIAKAFGMGPQELLRTDQSKRMILEIRINDCAFNCPEEAIIEVVKRIRSAIGDSRDFELISVSRGSIKLRIALGPDEALRLLAAIDEGQLDECGVESASLEEPGDEHRDMSDSRIDKITPEDGWQFDSEPRDSVSALIRLLDAKDPAIYRFTARALSRMGPLAVSVLAELLRDPDPDVRERAAGALRMLSRGRDPDVREKAAGALKMLGRGRDSDVLADPTIHLRAASEPPTLSPSWEVLVAGLPNASIDDEDEGVLQDVLFDELVAPAAPHAPAMTRILLQRSPWPLSRKLAIGMAVVCFLLAAVFAFGQVGNRLLGAVICLFVGLMMLIIGMTGFWPRRPVR
jgi:transcriptional regulator with XRE-family HTH domain